MNQSWDEMREAIRREFKLAQDRFLRQPTIKLTLHPDNPGLARSYCVELQQTPYGLELISRARDPDFGTPRRYSESCECSMVALQHAWQLSKLHEVLDVSPSGLETISEIGGGYGDMCRQIRAGGFSGPYAIYDFPELRDIQRQYLKSCDVSTSELSFETGRGNNSLLIATFSVSEMPLHERSEIESSFAGYRYLMLSWNPSFAGIDNAEWFSGLAQRLSESHEVSILKDPHMRGWYLFGKAR